MSSSDIHETVPKQLQLYYANQLKILVECARADGVYLSMTQGFDGEKPVNNGQVGSIDTDTVVMAIPSYGHYRYGEAYSVSSSIDKVIVATGQAVDGVMDFSKKTAHIVPAYRPHNLTLAEEVTVHKVEGDDSPLRLVRLGAKNHAGAHNAYTVPFVGTVRFQDGNPLTEGYNGFTLEHLMAMCYDRLSGYQTGPFACDDNQEAAEHLARGIEALQRRTKDRIARQVKNTEKL